ncbi:hypothetical protein [Helicobacter saguini]|uniref:Uncharacterized protein n=1 Tax=Helicobacter saguini TaxID=1548018 RepID=A0A6L7DEJ1_9HELI|nr:hypothetical protein [Helicobacter saguini]MWV62967.1 hypothetical protein [Helicobacter saguini]MWV68716.1 hypothetical protein [Helicobacter saguini]MWV71733.1 hypothetical protein [Helicobacter saguini]
MAMISSKNARFLAIKSAFNNIDLPQDSITIEGNWDSFVKQGYINALSSQISKQATLNHSMTKIYKELDFEIESSFETTQDSKDLANLDSINTESNLQNFKDSIKDSTNNQNSQAQNSLAFQSPTHSAHLKQKRILSLQILPRT